MLLVVPGVLRIPMPPQFKFTLSSPSTLPQVLAVLLKGPLEDAAAAAEFKTKAAAAFPHRSVRGGGAEWEGSICPARNGGLFPRMRSQSRFVPPPPPPLYCVLAARRLERAPRCSSSGTHLMICSRPSDGSRSNGLSAVHRQKYSCAEV